MATSDSIRDDLGLGDRLGDRSGSVTGSVTEVARRPAWHGDRGGSLGAQ